MCKEEGMGEEKKSNSEMVFESLKVKPKLFINEAFNTVDDVLHSAFLHFLLEASKLLGADQDVNRSADLKKGVALLKYKVHSVVDKRLNLWERYCLTHCFALPEGFLLPKDAGLAGDSSIDRYTECDRELDEQLDSLRNEIATVVKETAERNKELCVQKRKSEINNQLASSVDEVSQLFEQHSETFEEVRKTAVELREKMEQQSKRLKLDRFSRIERKIGSTEETFREDRANGLSIITVEELKEFIADMNNLQNGD